ncbi:MAG: nucleotidyl transferase AbiEii/AbiGii toxin family protein [Anaerolineaceae bacterium]|nr:nucleotidyl transferase AbiEii/AbiGii toxin family protein [Anaerolineaceae bacterium]
MLDFQQIKDQYPKNLQRFDRAILREYLQYKVLQAIFDSKHASKLAFLGGTALRIIYGNLRFSEDIDLDNFGLSWAEFEEVIQEVKRFMELEGFEVEIRNIAKGAYRCYLKFPTLLYEQGLSPFQEEKILIQIDTSAQGYQYEPEIILINKFDIYTEIRVTPLNILLSQKIYTAVNRIRPKGRDFYDITYLSGRTKPDMDFLKQKMGVNTVESLKKEITVRIEAYDFMELTEDVSPFLINLSDIKRVEKFKVFWNQVDLE